MPTTIHDVHTQALAPRIESPENVARTMSSREIAELTGKRHDNVLRDIRAYVGAILKMERGVDVKSLDWATSGGVQLFEDTSIGGVSCRLEPNHQNGMLYPIYYLDQASTLTVVAGYNVLLRKKIIDRWLELEARPIGTLEVPSTFADALRLAAEQVERNQILQKQVDAQAPKVAAIKRLAAAQGAICITDAAKQLQVAPTALFAWLQEHRWIYRRQGSKRWIGYQPRIQAGWITHKVTSLKPDPETGAERAAFDPLITPRGLTVLAEKVPGAKL